MSEPVEPPPPDRRRGERSHTGTISLAIALVGSGLALTYLALGWLPDGILSSTRSYTFTLDGAREGLRSLAWDQTVRLVFEASCVGMLLAAIVLGIRAIVLRHRAGSGIAGIAIAVATPLLVVLGVANLVPPA